MLEAACVKLIANGHVVGTVEHQVVFGNLHPQRRVFQHCIQRIQLNVWVNARQRLASGVHLRLTDGGIAVQRLAL